MGNERSDVSKSSVNITFHGGRQDCSDSPRFPREVGVNQFPGPTMTHDEMMSFFQEDFDMTPPQVTLLENLFTNRQYYLYII